MTLELLRNTEVATETMEDTIVMIGFFMKEELGISIMNTDTGEVTTQVTNKYGIFDMLSRYKPAHTLIYTIKEWEPEMLMRLSANENVEMINVNYYELKDVLADFRETRFSDQYLPYTIIASQFFMQNYISETNPEGIRLYPVRYIKTRDHMYMDESVIEGLDLFESKFDGKKHEGSLYYMLNRTITAKGERMLKEFIEQPLISNKKILARQLVVEFFNTNVSALEELRNILEGSADLEKILTRLGNGRIKPEEVPVIIDTATLYHVFLVRLSELCDVSWVKRAAEQYSEQLIVELERLDTFLSPTTVMTEGFDPEFDEVRLLKENAENSLDLLLTSMKEATGIKNLKVNTKHEFLGYTFDVTKTGWAKVPSDWIELCTNGNTKSYYTQELQERTIALTEATDIYNSAFRRAIIKATELVNEGIGVQQNVLEFVSLIDVLMSFGEVAREHGWIKPRLIKSGGIHIEDGVNPILQGYIRRNMSRNDTELNDGEIHLVTGANMGGKTTYLKMVGLLTVLAQIGSFVPATMTLAPVNRIFLRIGASDFLLKGKSTFAKEMDDLAYILHHATRFSLVLLDELGQSTKSKEGIAIAKSTLHYIANKIGAKTICTSHYDELTELENEITNFRNFHMETLVEGNKIKLTYSLREGASSESYGLAVANAACLPKEVLAMTANLLNN